MGSRGRRTQRHRIAGVSARTTYVALLRGINLGARNKLAMADLRALVEGLGAEDDLRAERQRRFQGRRQVGRARSQDRGADPPRPRPRGPRSCCVPRLGKKVLTDNPFVKSRKTRRLHVTFLADTPDRARLRQLDTRTPRPTSSASAAARSTSTARTATAGPSSRTPSSRSSSPSSPRPATGGRSRRSRSSRAPDGASCRAP